MAACYDCARPYGDEHGFPDLVIPHAAWAQISPRGDDGGLYCPSCICKRLHAAGISCQGVFTSGPIVSVAEADFNVFAKVQADAGEVMTAPRDAARILGRGWNGERD